MIGVGALGQAHAIKAQLMGAGRVFAIDPSQKRLDVAARVAGAEPADADELRNVDLVVDATGFPGSFAKAIEIVRDGGTIIEVGAFVNMGEETFNPAVLCGRNLTLMGIGGEDLLVYERTLALLARHVGDPVRRDGLPSLPGRRRAGGDGDRARRRALREGPDHRLSASSSAARMTAGSGSTPVQCRIAITPWLTSIPRPSSTVQPRASASRISRVRGGLGITSATTVPGRSVSRSSGSERRGRGGGRSTWR